MPLWLRFWPKVTLGPQEGLLLNWFPTLAIASCWAWNGALTANGYGLVGVGGRSLGSQSAHRVAWWLTPGHVPEGKQLHHVCNNRACMNPFHMFAVTHQEHRDAERLARA